MATFTASAAQAGAPAIMHVNRTITRTVRYTHPVAMSAGDVIQMLKVPAGAIVSRVVNGVSASAGAITVNIGDGNDTSAYGASIVLSGQAINAGSVPYRGFGRSYSAEDTIDFVATVVSAAPGTVDLLLIVEYTLHNGG
jgi:hypothetical protein